MCVPTRDEKVENIGYCIRRNLVTYTGHLVSLG
jgi:hypothetical protein